MQAVIWTGPFIGYQPLEIGGDEPTLSNGNLIKSTMLGAPFTWPWNRVESDPIPCTVGVQDYTVSLPNFGFIEKAWLTLGEETKEIEVKTTLAKSSTQARPEYIAVVRDDNAGNITFRLMNVPDQAYTLTVQFQQKAVPFTSLAIRWDPIPDELSYIYLPGFLAMCMVLKSDARFPIFNDRFVSHLLGAQSGLDELQKSIFIGNWTDVMRQLQAQQGKTQSGVGGRTK
jgi:hypothetical protein